jgi:hypothetical protein
LSEVLISETQPRLRIPLVGTAFICDCLPMRVLPQIERYADQDMLLIRSCVVAALIVFQINHAARAQALAALQTCISQNVRDNTLVLNNSQRVREGSSGRAKVTGSVWVLSCTDNMARQLWDELKPYKTNTTEWVNTDRSQIQSIWFGDYHSTCSRVLNNPDGSPGEYYWCNIFLDLPDSVVQGLR